MTVNSETYQLVVRKGPTPGQIFPLESDLITVGRDPLSDIVVDDPEVSRHHARMTLSAGTYLLQDRGSTNGSFVDGSRLGGDPVQLNPGQVIMFGTTVTMVFQAIPAEDPMATVVAPAAPISVEKPPIEEVSTVEEEFEEPAPEPEAEPPSEPMIEDVIEEASEAEVVFEMAVEEEMPEVVELEDELPILIDGEEEESVTPEDEVEVAEIQPDLEEEEEAEEEEEMATMIEPIPFQAPEEPTPPEAVEVEPEPPAMPVFDEPEPEPEDIPTFDEVEPEELPVVEEPAFEIELPAEPPPLEPLPSYEEALPEPEPEPEPSLETPIFGFERGAADEIIDSAAPMKDLGSEAPEQPVLQTTGEVVEEKGSPKRNRNVILGIAAFVVFCCLCIAISAAAYFLIFPNM